MKERDINKHRYKKHKGWNRLRGRQSDAETTRQYTEQEIQSLSRVHDHVAGIIRPDTGNLHMPTDLAEPVDQTSGASRVILVIITLASIFIAIITYFVSQMPRKD
jgi:hypothetical protein